MTDTPDTPDATSATNYRSRTLRVPGAVAFDAPVFGDDRGSFSSPFRHTVFADGVGRPLFAPRQNSYSVSRRGVVRGLHYTATPPGSAKLVHCPHGRVLDVVVDIRVGSPSFGAWDAIELSPASGISLFLPTGLGHLFVVLEDTSVVSYMLAAEYRPENELAIDPFDPDLGLPVPGDAGIVLSARDRAAPTLEQAREAGLLPRYEECLAIDGDSDGTRRADAA